MKDLVEGIAIGLVALGIVGPGNGARYGLLSVGLLFLWRMR